MLSLTPAYRYARNPPPLGVGIDWGKAHTSLRYAVVMSDSGGPLIDTNPFAQGPAPLERVMGMSTNQSYLGSTDNQQHHDGLRWWYQGGVPTGDIKVPNTTQANISGFVQGQLSQDRISIAIRLWNQSDVVGAPGDGAIRDGLIWNGVIAADGQLQVSLGAQRSTNSNSWYFGNVSGGGGIQWVDADPYLGFHSYLLTGSTGVLQPAGLRVFKDGLLYQSQGTWSGVKWTVGQLQIGAYGPSNNPFAGIISYVYVFDDYVTDEGFAQLLHENPYYLFEEPRNKFISIPLTPTPPPAPTAGESLGMVIVTLPAPQAGIEGYGVFPGVMTKAVSAAMGSRMVYEDAKVLVFTSTAGAQKSYTLEGTSDAGTAFDVMWRSGLTPTPKLQTHRIEGVEPFMTRAATFGVIQVAPVTSNILDTVGGSVGAMVDVDLTRVKVFSLTSLDARGRFLGLKFSGSSSDLPAYQGAAIYGRRV